MTPCPPQTRPETCSMNRPAGIGLLLWLTLPAAATAPGGDNPRRLPELIRHARTDRLLESFERNVWAWRFRCMNCHIEGTPQNDKFRKEHGIRVAWIKKDGATATMDYLIASKLNDVKGPDKQL